MKNPMKAFDWYSQLKKPKWAPPSWIFGPAWAFLYIGIIRSFGYVFIHTYNGDLPVFVCIPFVLNLIFNALFTPIQFGLKNNKLAAIDIVLTWITIVWMMIVVYPFVPLISYMQIPYFLWVSFATVLQLTVTWMNRKK